MPEEHLLTAEAHHGGTTWCLTLSPEEARQLIRDLRAQLPVSHGHRYVYRYTALAEREDGSIVRLPGLDRLSATPCYASMARSFARMVEPEASVFVSALRAEGPFAYFDSESQDEAMRRTQETGNSLQTEDI